MTRDLIIKIKELPRLKLLIILFTIWQYFCVAGIALLNWPNSLVWLNLGMLTAFILIAPIYESLLLLILAIPFSVALPNSRFDSLPMWRILYIVLFAVWLIRDKKIFSKRKWFEDGKFLDITFLPWDKYLAWFLIIGFLSA